MILSDSNSAQPGKFENTMEILFWKKNYLAITGLNRATIRDGRFGRFPLVTDARNHP
jgi:hypothetical protein